MYMLHDHFFHPKYARTATNLESTLFAQRKAAYDGHDYKTA